MSAMNPNAIADEVKKALNPNDPFTVLWETPSRDAAGSLPMGNGEVGINLWVDEGGSLFFYISRSDSLSEVSRLVKVGGVQIQFTPNPLNNAALFKQLLLLREGICQITMGRGGKKLTLKVFVDVDQPVIHIVGSSTSPISVKATPICWRKESRTIQPGEDQLSAWAMHEAPFPLIEAADVFPSTTEDALVWYHRNEKRMEIAYPSTIEIQSLESIADLEHDPLLNRTFGGWMVGAGFKKAEGHTIQSEEHVKSFALRVAAPCFQAVSAQEWMEEAQRIAAASADFQRPMRKTRSWWKAYWERSWVLVSRASIAAQSPSDAEAESLTRGYILQNYMQACGGKGTYPIKFNGGVFTVEPKAMNKPYSPDWRAWGECYWWQNTRHMYHPMPAAGSTEMMSPLFKMYRDVLPICEGRAKLYYQSIGSYFPETMTIWGTYSNCDYGWNREGHPANDVMSPWWRYAWNQGPELVALMLDNWDYTQHAGFLKQQLLPMALSVLRYFDTRFKKDSDGKIVLNPDQSVETYWYDVINDTPTVAGLNDITARLCDLPSHLLTTKERRFFERMREACPAVATEEAVVDGKPQRIIAPAKRYEKRLSNCENPELYAIWPFRLYGIGRPGLEMARATYAHRINHLDVGWGYDGNCAALLGLREEAARIMKVKCANSNPAYRWPATWGPNFDWLPDQNHGGNLLETTQLMLLQYVGRKIWLLPAWPEDWDVHFKLHAPYRTVVECNYRRGKIVDLKVTPDSRAKDVVDMSHQSSL